MPRFDAFVENATNWPVEQVPAAVVTIVVDDVHELKLGFSEGAFAGVVPPGVEIRTSDGVQVVGVVAATPMHVSRIYTCCVGPTPTIKLVEGDAKATKRPSSDIADSSDAPSDGVCASSVASGDEIRLVEGAHVLPATPIVVMHVDRSKICGVPLRLAEEVIRFVAVDVNETNRPSSAIARFELAPFPGVIPSLGETDTRYVVGVHEVELVPEGGTKLQVFRM